MEQSRIFPTWDQIFAFRNPLTVGELSLAKYLDAQLPSEWEIYVQPFFNGDRPDIVVFNKQVGLVIFEVKDWHPTHYHYEDQQKKHKTFRQYFVTDARGTWPIPSPVNQVERYRENLISLYLPEIGEAIDANSKNLAAFRVGLYFHNMTTEKAQELVPVRTSQCVVFGKDRLTENNLADIVVDVNRKSSLSMREGWVDKIKFWLRPPFHSMEQATKLDLTPEQKRHVEPAPGRHQRLRGVAGSGKSLVIAQRAANLASQGKKILVVTYNITLWHYIRDLVSRAKPVFDIEQTI